MAFIKTRAGFDSTPGSGTLRELLLESVPHGLFSGWLKSGAPRDIIFAFLGLCADSEKLGIYAGYPKPCALIYIQLTKALLSSRALGILSHCQFPKCQGGLLFWTPDYTQPGERDLIDYSNRAINENFF